MKIAVGMSGGVDSSVAALLLLRAGHAVSGVLMKIWPGPRGAGRREERLLRAGRGRGHPGGLGGLRQARAPVPGRRLFRRLRGPRPPLFSRRLRGRNDAQPLRPLQPAGQVRRPSRDRPRLGPCSSIASPPATTPGRRADPSSGRVLLQRAADARQRPVLFPVPPEPDPVGHGPLPAGRADKGPGPGHRPRGRAARPRQEGEPGLLRRRPRRTFSAAADRKARSSTARAASSGATAASGATPSASGKGWGSLPPSPSTSSASTPARTGSSSGRRARRSGARRSSGIASGDLSRRWPLRSTVRVKVRSGGRLVPATIAPLDGGRCRRRPRGARLLRRAGPVRRLL